jgi:hypothetical protein
VDVVACEGKSRKKTTKELLTPGRYGFSLPQIKLVAKLTFEDEIIYKTLIIFLKEFKVQIVCFHQFNQFPAFY